RGCEVSRKLDKMGWLCSDTAELSFRDALVPMANLVGEEGSGFKQIMRHFQSERIGMAVLAYAVGQRCLDLSLEWARQRQSFGRRLVELQVIRHKLAEMARRGGVGGGGTQGGEARGARGGDAHTHGR